MGYQKAVLFDLDDTLYMEKTYVDSGFRAVSTWVEKEMGIPHRTALSELRRITREEHGHTFDRFLARHDLLDRSRVEAMIAVYRSHEPRIELVRGMGRLLAEVRRSCRVGLVSDGTLAVQRRKLRALGLLAVLDCVVLSDEWGQDAWKPSPLPFEKALDHLGVPASSCLYVADNPTKDFLAPNRMGMGTVRVLWRGGLYRSCSPPSAGHAPDLEVRRLHDLRRTILDACAKPPGKGEGLGGPDARCKIN